MLYAVESVPEWIFCRDFLRFSPEMPIHTYIGEYQNRCRWQPGISYVLLSV